MKPNATTQDHVARQTPASRPTGFSLPGVSPASALPPRSLPVRGDIETLETRQLFSTVGVDESSQYFTDTDGEAVFLSGYYAWGAVTDGYYIDHPRSYKGYRELGQQYDLNYIRISLGVNRFSNTTSPASVIPAGDYYRGATPIPFETDGSGRVNLDRFDQRFWDGLAAQVAGAGAQGQIAHIALFDGVDIRTSFSSNDTAFRWPNSFWNPANHQRDFYGYGELGWNVDLDGSGDGNADQDGDFYRTGDFNGNYGVGKYQRALIDKALQTLAPYQNVLLEVGNELSASAGWNNAVIDYINSQQPRYGTDFAITANPLGGNLGELFYKAGSRAEGVAYHEADTALQVKQHLAQIDNFATLPVWEDPDGPALNRASSQELRQAAWFSLTGGAAGWGGYTETDANPDRNTLRYYQNLQRFLDQADIDLSDFRPDHGLITNGNTSNSVLADRGDTYIAYVLWDGQVGLDLSAIDGDARVRFYNPESGQFVGEQTVRDPGYETFYRPGGASDWVILVEEVTAQAQPQPTYIPPPTPAPAPAPPPAPTRAPAPAPTPSGNALWFEGFDLGSGATNDYGTTEWTTNGFTAGLHAVRDNAFVANNTDNEVIFRTEVIDLGPVGNHARVALDLRSDGGLDSGQDYFSVNVILDGGAEQNIAYFDGVANNNNTVNIRSANLWASRLQVVIRQKNTSTGETYTFDNLRVEPAASSTPAPAPTPASPPTPAPAGGDNDGSRFRADFNEANGTQWTAGGNGWFIDRGTNGTFAVENGAFTAANTYGEGVWKSAAIDTNGLRNAGLSVDITSSGGFDGNSYLRIGYIVDGREVTFFDGNNTINDNRTRVVTADLPEGTSVQLVVRTNASGGSYKIDNLRVGESLGSGGTAAPAPSPQPTPGGGTGGGFTIFNEGFDNLGNGTRLDTADTGWWVEQWPNGVFQVENNRFEIRGTYGTGVLKTQLIDLRPANGNATISFDLDSSGSFSDPGSYLNIFVELDGQRRTLYSGGNGINGNNGDRISVSGLSGDFAQIIIEGSATNGTLTVDNLRVDAGTGGGSNAPAQQTQQPAASNGTERVRFDRPIEAYSWLDGEGGDAAPSPQVRFNASTATLRGNSWKKMQLPRTMNIGWDTVLEFDARTTNWPQVEIAGLGFDNNDDPYDSERIVQIAGTQSAGRLASDARGTGIGFGDQGWSYYRVKLSEVLSDFRPFQATHLILVSDHDTPSGSNLSNYATTDFANVRITSAG